MMLIVRIKDGFGNTFDDFTRLFATLYATIHAKNTFSFSGEQTEECLRVPREKKERTGPLKLQKAAAGHEITHDV